MLTGNEKWVVAGNQGAEIYHGEWPIVGIELNCEIITIDVCGLTQLVDLHDDDVKIGFYGDVIEDVYAE